MLPLIDAYDLLQSDRVNDKQQFADALLVLTGVMGLTAPEDGDGRTPANAWRQDKTLAPARQHRARGMLDQGNP